MTHTDSIEVSEATSDRWHKLVTRLKEVGAVAEEDAEVAGIHGREAVLSPAEQELRARGFEGGPLQLHRFDVPREGNTFLIYDASRYRTGDDAESAWIQDYRRRWRQRISARVDDWLQRLRGLRASMERWIAASGLIGVRIIDRPPARMHEELMQKFEVPAREVPVFDVVGDDRRLMRVQPKGLWVLGANGRVDLITKTASPILIDASEPLSGSTDWQLYQFEGGLQPAKLDQDTFVRLLKE